MNPFVWLEGWRTYVAAFGLFGLAVYQFSLGHFPEAYQSFFAALAAFGLRQAIAKSK
jgi:hypothetical protein